MLLFQMGSSAIGTMAAVAAGVALLTLVSVSDAALGEYAFLRTRLANRTREQDRPFRV